MPERLQRRKTKRLIGRMLAHGCHDGMLYGCLDGCITMHDDMLFCSPGHYLKAENTKYGEPILNFEVYYIIGMNQFALLSACFA